MKVYKSRPQLGCSDEDDPDVKNYSLTSIFIKIKRINPFSSICFKHNMFKYKWMIITNSQFLKEFVLRSIPVVLLTTRVSVTSILK